MKSIRLNPQWLTRAVVHPSRIGFSAGCFLIVALLAATAVQADVPGTDGPATDAPSMSIMALGDSNTAGFHGTPEIRGSYRLRLQQRLDAAGMSNFDFVGSYYRALDGLRDGDHQGVGGYKIQDMTATYFDAVNQFSPDYILVLAGTNNRNDPADYDLFVDQYTDLIDMLVTASPDSQIIMSTVPRIGYDRPDLPHWTKQWVDYRNYVLFPTMNQALVDVAGRHEGIKVVDLYPVIDPYTDLNVDQLHLNHQGHDKLGDLFFSAMSASAVPEPSSAGIIAVGGLWLATRRRRRP